MTSDHMEELQMHAIEVLATREEEKEKALEVKAEETFRANESFRRSVLDKDAWGPARGWRPTEESKKDL